MAFFRFPWPGKRDDASPTSGQYGYRATASTHSVQDMRRRARNRLVGAAVLVVLGVVGFPLLFDTQPRPIPVDIPIEIPERNQVIAPLVLEEGGAEAGSSVTTPVAALAPEVVAVPVKVAGASSQPVARQSDRVSASAARVSAAQPLPSSAPQPVRTTQASAAPEPSPRTGAGDEAARARALLEGRVPVAVVAVPAPTAAPAPTRFIVQVGAFADPEKANETRRRLEAAGLKTYTQAIDTAAGLRIRVRVGPFSQRADAEKAAAQVVQLGMSGSVLTL